MGTFPFGKVIIALIVIMAIVAGVGLYLGSEESAPPTTTTTPMTPEEQIYKITIENRVSIIDQALDAIRELMTNPQIGDSQWRVNVVIQLAWIQALYDEAIELDPPSSMAHIRDKYVEAMEHYETATQQIKQGIDEVNVNLIEQAIVEMNTGSQLLTDAIELLNEFIEAHSQ